MATGTITVRLRNRISGKQSGPVSISYTVADSALIGGSVGLNTGESFANGLIRTDQTIGPLDIVRVFYTGLPATWVGSKAAICNRPTVVSFKAPPSEINAGTHDSFLTSWFASLPKTGFPIYWGYYHEPEDDVEKASFTAADFRTAWRRVAALARAANNPKLFNTLILMGWTVNPASGRNFPDFYPGADLVDVIAWDCYSQGAKTGRYFTPDETYGAVIAKSIAYGKPWGIAETGSTMVASDTSGTGRAAWLKSVRTYLSTRNPVFVCYWNQVVGADDYRLADAPSQAEWRSYCQS